MANEVRGEFTIPLEGVDHVMRPTWEAIVAFEAATGKSLVVLAQNASAGNLTMREMGTIAGECIRAFGKAENNASHAGVNDQAVMRCIADLGALHALKPLQQLLLIAATGGVDASGKVKAAVMGNGSTELGATAA